MTPNNNLSVLPWYNDIRYQNHRKSYAYGAVYPLFALYNMLLPFQIQRATRAGANFTVTVRSLDGLFVENITQQLLDTGLQLVRFESLGYDVIVFPANFTFVSGIKPGQHYIQLSDGVETWFSDVFTAVYSVDDYLKIEWWDIDNLYTDFGAIVYKAPAFKNILYLCSEIGKPDYEFVEEGEDRDNIFFAEKQISEKTYKFTFLAPEFVCDAIRIIRLSDKVVITSQGRTYAPDTFLPTVKWQTQGDIASVEVEFQTNTIVKKIGAGFIQPSFGADFNDDFNNDFKTDNN